ncbi:MAG: SGNH/GDSL hydrolase family protein [Burkholderiaceae bacterium]|nr:SGNH/GDSL hydrolase family protein [Burkholderiaceae bacterium]
MLHLATTIALGPLLLLQGRHVRRITPVLPEAAGPRAGATGEGPPLRLLILGDSAAAGVGALSQDQALSGHLVAALGRRHAVDWTLQARTGATTQEALQLLADLPRRPLDVVVTSLGVNDVTGNVSVRRWVDLQEQLVSDLRAHFGQPRILMSALPPMHRFPALPQPLRAYLGAQARRYNAALAALAARTDGCTWVPLDLPNNEGDMAGDGFHPGPAIYAAWAGELARHILVPP